MADIVDLILADNARIRALIAEVETALGQVDDTDSGALARFRRDASVQTREALGRQWVDFVADSMRHDP
jgi:hypothetical protein